MTDTAAMTASDFTTQDWDAYTPEDHAVWGILYRRRMVELAKTASHVFLDGAAAIGLEADAVPDLARVNDRLDARTGWNAVPVRGFLPAPQFFQCIAERRFPTTVTVRPRAQLDYLPEPDIFHDVFGHVPLHSDPVFADFLPPTPWARRVNGGHSVWTRCWRSRSRSTGCKMSCSSSTRSISSLRPCQRWRTT